MKKTLLFLLCFLSYSVVNAQSNSEVEVSYAIKRGTTPKVKDLVEIPPTSNEKRAAGKKNKKQIIPNFSNYEPGASDEPGALPIGPDKVWQKSIVNTKSAGDLIEPSVNRDGLTSFAIPADPTGDTGADHYLQAVNATSIGVYDKDGTYLSQFSGNSLWTSLGFSSAGDPIILYDQEYEKWIITEFVSPDISNVLLVAVSHSSDPYDNYDVYEFGTAQFPDYPKYSIWNNAIVVTTNEFVPANTLPCYFMDRAALMNGADEVQIQKLLVDHFPTAPGIQVGTPVDWTGQNPPKEDKPIVLSLSDDGWGGNLTDRVIVSTFEIDFDNQNNSGYTQVEISPSPFDTDPCSAAPDGFACIPQPGGVTGMNAMVSVIMNQVHYRNFDTHESIVLNFVVDATGDNTAGVRWMELRREDGGEWELYQEGTFAPDDGLNRFMGAICMDGQGNIGLAYGCGGENDFISLRFTGRRATDPLGEMTIEEYVIAPGGAAINNFSRYGDYHQMGIDPVDDATFWFTGEYPSAGGMRTRIAAFSLERDSLDVGPSGLVEPQNADDLTDAEVVRIAVKNQGLNPVSNYQVGYIFEGGEAVISEPITTEIASEETYVHTFDETIDVSEITDYELILFTIFDGDNNEYNDSCRVTLTKLPRFDVGASNVYGIEEGACAASILEVDIEMTNYGTNDISSAFVSVTVNGVIQHEFINEELVPAGESTIIPLILTDLIDGTNTIKVNIFSPNLGVDERPDNNIFEADFQAVIDGQRVAFTLNTDDYPTETQWYLTDNTGTIVYSGGPYQQVNATYTEEWCLKNETCYNFQITDSFGDGICCGWGQGSYNIVDAEGNALVVSDGVFGTSEDFDFCTELVCAVSLDLDISAETSADANNGAVLIYAYNASDPVQYSIDGGATFTDVNLFADLAPGTYDIVVVDGNDCETSETIEIAACDISLIVDVADETWVGAENGAITITASGGQAPFSYSIDGGVTYQSSNTFEGLTEGTYIPSVFDVNNCELFFSAVSIGLTTNNSEIKQYGGIFNVFPNPTEGVVTIHLDGFQHDSVLLDFEVFDISGKRIQNGKLVKYNDTYKGTVSVVSYPSGVYFIRFKDESFDKLLRIVKQ